MNWIQNAYMKLKIKHKLFILVSLIIIASFSFTHLVLRYAYRIYDEQIYEKSSQALMLSSIGIENEIKKIENISFNIIKDARIQHYLEMSKQKRSKYKDFRFRSQLMDYLLGYAGENKNILSIHLFDHYGKKYVVGIKTIEFAPEKETQIFDDAVKGMGGTRWIYPDERDYSLIAIRQIRSYSKMSLDHLGTVAIRVNMDEIANKVKESGELEGNLIIVSGKNVIFPRNPKFTKEQILTLARNKQGYRIEEINGQLYFITYIRSNYTGWTYLNAFPFKQIFDKIIIMKDIINVVFISMFCFVAVLGLKFSKSLTNPIENLIAKMRRVQQGEIWEVGMDSHTSEGLPPDEIGQLHRNFELMIHRINELISENYSKQLMIKETEFRALQAQINPHFLYNTLESINWLAKINQQGQISQMVEALGFLLRNSMSLNEHLVTLGKELEIVENYITIQKIRFGERLDFQADVAQEIRDYYIPKFTLQPLIENAILYALEPTAGICKISIQAVSKPECIVLIVADNGPGMSQTLLEKVRKGEARTRNKGIGLKNIDERIRLTFGESYGLCLDSEPGRGTRVSIILPRKSRCS